MAQETATDRRTDTDTARGLEAWQAGVVGGIAGGFAMGIMLTMQMTPVIENAIPALWGLSGGLAGWVVHMSNSAVLGVVFAAIASAGALREYSDSVGTGTALGVAYGVVLWVVLAAVVMPIWLDAVGFPMAPAVPNFNPLSLVGHVVYGGVLGATYAALR
ncbi:histidine kinase [Halostella sp. JP-L12]|uniref:histidine kinase n=1 Tax=Halostella TaxID=1843185 RepID=UPI000EF7C520|nr:MULTISPECIES: histidine kinase [Halostella]NHN46259.1 histidine kinase [Halostella sp. JP-L12]